MLAPLSTEHAEFFQEEAEAFFYHDSQDMTVKAQEMLALDAESAKRIRNNARTRCVRAGYSYKNRSEFVVETFKRFLEYPPQVNHR